MALKDIFKMTKANRYTADGREELIKAQEAVTEDRRYNIGEISEKTGLQKTANGWVKPKTGKAKSSEAETGKTSRMDAWLNEDPSKMSDQELMRRNETLHSLGNSAKGDDFKKVMNAGIKIEEELTKRKLPTNPDGIGYEEEKKKAGKSESKPAESTSAPKTIKFEDAEKAVKNGQVVQWQDRDGNWNDIDPKTSELVMAKSMGSKLRVKTDADGNPVMQKPDPTKNEVRSKLLELEKRRKKFEKYPEEDNDIRLQQASLLSKAGFSSRKEFDDFVKSEMPNDSAPRILTGDTRIRVRN